MDKKTKVRVNVSLETVELQKGKALARQSKRSFSSEVGALIENEWQRIADLQMPEMKHRR